MFLQQHRVHKSSFSNLKACPLWRREHKSNSHLPEVQEKVKKTDLLHHMYVLKSNISTDLSNAFLTWLTFGDSYVGI